MINAVGLLRERRFLPLFVTQFLGAFNDNLFKTAMVLFVTYGVYSDPKVESNFNALATGLSLLPFVLLSALSGQLADGHDKARIIRLVKTAEIFIMLIGAAGLLLAQRGYTNLGIGMMLGAVLLLGVHSTFFGPIKYAILPQHLPREDVLGGTALVEAGTYLSILMGTVLAGWLTPVQSAVAVLIVAAIGWLAGRQVPAAPRMGPELKLNWNPLASSWRLVAGTMHIPRLFLAICAISFFWTIGAVLVVIFPPLVKNVLTADERVASMMIAIFSVGVAIGSVVINTMLKGRISARFSPASVIGMAGCVVVFALITKSWHVAPDGQYYGVTDFMTHPQSIALSLALVAIAVTGGMFVVPLYAFLTTTVTGDQTARTVAANNVVNALAMVLGSVLVIALTQAGVSPDNMLFLVAAMCLTAAWIAQKLHRACD